MSYNAGFFHGCFGAGALLREPYPHSANELYKYCGSHLVDFELLKSESPHPRKAGVIREVLKRKKQEQ